jgi:hypothetical protein
VRQLSDLYTVVIGVALTIAAETTLHTSNFLNLSASSSTINLFTFLIIIVPFYHGAVRHLFATYIEGGGSKRIKNGALLADFFLLFVEGCLFVMMAWSLPDSKMFAWVIVAVLILDSVWGFLAWLAITGAQAQYAERTWALLNATTAAILAAILIYAKDAFVKELPWLQFGILGIIGLRTTLDYILGWNFYFPSYDADVEPKKLTSRRRAAP